MKFDGTLVVWERIIARLGPFTTQQMEGMVGPIQVTQDGIGEALGLSRAHVAITLSKLIDEGRVEERLQHVNGASSRRKTYYLTEEGRKIYDELASMVDVPLGTLIFAPANKTARRRDPLEEIAKIRGRLNDIEARYLAQEKALELSKGVRP
jgi:DNA-binding MarR family transcriptional regulator